jgi:hypothetical protein
MIKLTAPYAVEPSGKLRAREPQDWARAILAVTHFDQFASSPLLDAAPLVGAHRRLNPLTHFDHSSMGIDMGSMTCQTYSYSARSFGWSKYFAAGGPST